MRIDQTEASMRMAEVAAMRSTCDRLNVGAVIVHQFGRVLSTGFNGNPSGMAHCNHYAEEVNSGMIAGCTTAVHAEANAIVWAARMGVKIEGASIYTTHQPCLECAKLIVNAGLRQVFFKHPYRLRDGLEMLMRIPWIDVFHMTEDYSIIQMRQS